MSSTLLSGFVCVCVCVSYKFYYFTRQYKAAFLCRYYKYSMYGNEFKDRGPGTGTENQKL